MKSEGRKFGCCEVARRHAVIYIIKDHFAIDLYLSDLFLLNLSASP